MSGPPARVLAAIERNRRRMWAICYRMTGLRADADDLAQEAAARAIERCDQIDEPDPTGWLLRLTTRLCLDHLRHKKVERRLTELVDPLLDPDWPPGDVNARAGENVTLLREDVRFAVVVALQALSPRQRAVLILHDVCDHSLDEVALLLDTNSNAAKAVLHRARLALSNARRHEAVDVPVDSAVVERFANAIEAGRLDLPVTAQVVVLNGERSIVIRLRDVPAAVVAVVHLETRGGQVVALRINRDPRRTTQLVALN